MFTSTRTTRLRRLGVPLTALLLASVSACGGSTEGADASTGDAAKYAEAAQAKVDALYEGTFADPPATGPEAQRGHRIAVVNSGTQSPTGAEQAKAAKEVADLMGWDLTVYDGKYEPASYQEGIRQAIAQKADVIWLYSIDCPLAKSALIEAKNAGIPVVSQEAADCSDVNSSEEPLFTRTLQFSEGNFVEWGEALGAAQANWLVAKTKGDANVIEFAVPDLVITEAVHDGFVGEMKAICPSCKVTTVQIPVSDLGPQLQSKFETALLRNPNANGVAVSYDDLMTTGGAAAIVASGRTDQLAVVAGSGYPANNDLIRNNAGQDAGYGYDAGFETWAAADMVNRLLADEPAAPSGVGLALYDAENGLPGKGEHWHASVDYQSIFKKVWGVN